MSLLKDIMGHLDKTVKYDMTVKRLVLLTGISAYSNNPNNLFLKGQSSIGKTYDITRCLRYFPQSDVWYIGRLSPTALIHQGGGTLVDEQGRTIEKRYNGDKLEYYYQDLPGESIPKDEVHRILASSYKIVSLKNKILCFLDTPRYGTLDFLKPILSHDVREIQYRITEKVNGRLVTINTKVRDWPAAIFASASYRNMEEMVTRSLTCSPDESLNKIYAANSMLSEAASMPEEADEELPFLQARVDSLIQQLRECEILIPYATYLTKALPHIEAADMRHCSHYLQIIRTSALYSMESRPVIRYFKTRTKVPAADKTFLIATMEDLVVLREIYEEYNESIKSGLPGKVISAYKVLRELGDSSPEQLSIAIKERGLMPRTGGQLVNYELRHLFHAGLIEPYQDKDHGNKKRYSVISPDEFNQPKTSVILGSTELSIPFGEKEAEEWLDRVLYRLGVESNIEDHVTFQLGINSQAISKNEFLYRILSKQESNSMDPTEPKSSVIGEITRNAESSPVQPSIQSPTKNQENRPLNVDDGSVELFCPKCKQTGHFIKNGGWQRHLDVFHQGENLETELPPSTNPSGTNKAKRLDTLDTLSHEFTLSSTLAREKDQALARLEQMDLE